MKPNVLILPSIPGQEICILPETEEHLRSFANVIKNDKEEDLNEDEVKEIIGDIDGVITSWGSISFTPEVVEAAPKLKIISHAAGTVKYIASDAVWERGITVTNAADAISISVAEFAFLLMLAGLRKLIQLDNAMKVEKR